MADLRRDAWGHGVLAVAHAVTVAGARHVLVDSPGEVDALALEGISATVEGKADIDPAALYGLSGGGVPPVMRLVGHVLSTKPLRAGDAVSYGYTHRASADTSVALVTGGYAQGIVRALGNQACVEVATTARPIVGRVAMDVCVIDLEGTPVSLGEEITFFGGRGAAAGNLARWASITGLSEAELVTVAGSHASRGWEA
ncbi:MAG: alanine racemase C-terminal domain-containing protein [Candidatus Microbacterium colombiense]|nr:MAG: alanine racemase C-terminal domain-containing protein [Microbacterium sp.]